MVPMWFRSLADTTMYRTNFPGRTAAWFPHGSDVAPHFKRKQIIARRHLLAARQRGSCMAPMWFRNLTGTTSYRKGFLGRTAAWFPHGSDVAPHFKRKQVIATRLLLATRQRGSCMVPTWFRSLTGTTSHRKGFPSRTAARRVGEELSATRTRVELPIMT